MKRLSIALTALLVTTLTACSDSLPGQDTECTPNLSKGPCNEGEMVSCVVCDPDAGTIFGVQTCEAADAGYGTCKE